MKRNPLSRYARNREFAKVDTESSTRLVRENAEAHVEQACTRAHHETSLIEAGDTSSIIWWRPIVEVRAYICNINHGRKVRVPGPKLCWRNLEACFSFLKPPTKSYRPTSYTIGSGERAVVRFDPTGRESVTTSGNGVRCCWNAGICGIFDQSCPAP